MGGLEEEDNIPVAWRIYEEVSPKVVKKVRECDLEKPNAICV